MVQPFEAFGILRTGATQPLCAASLELYRQLSRLRNMASGPVRPNATFATKGNHHEKPKRKTDHDHHYGGEHMTMLTNWHPMCKLANVLKHKRQLLTSPAPASRPANFPRLLPAWLRQLSVPSPTDRYAPSRLGQTIRAFGNQGTGREPTPTHVGIEGQLTTLGRPTVESYEI